MSNSNCCFLTCIQISQDIGQVACYSHLFKNCPHFCFWFFFFFINTVKEDSTHGCHQMVNTKIRLIMFNNIIERCRSSIQSAKIRLGADCGSDHDLLIAKFWLKLNKVGKTGSPFKYDLNRIPYNYTVEVTNRFKGLDLIERLKNYGWRFVTGGSDQNHLQEKEKQKGKMVVWGGLTNSWERKKSKRQRRKGKIHSSECRVPLPFLAPHKPRGPDFGKVGSAWAGRVWIV